MGLLHLLRRLIDQEYVENWSEVIAELQRIARVRPERSESITAAEPLLMSLPWDKVFDFCERLYSHLTKDVYGYSERNEESYVSKPKSEVQAYVGNELRYLFLEEHLAFEFSNGLVRRRGRRNTAEQVSRAELVLGDPRFSKGREHFNKALRYFRTVAEPDYENVFKEAVCAVEAAARALFPDGGSTLGDVVKSITGSESGHIPATIAKTFHGMYGFRSAGEGVGHGGATGGPVTKELAEYALAVTASQIVLLVDLAAASDNVPF